jgi:hypothetical protein
MSGPLQLFARYQANAALSDEISKFNRVLATGDEDEGSFLIGLDNLYSDREQQQQQQHSDMYDPLTAGRYDTEGYLFSDDQSGGDDDHHHHHHHHNDDEEAEDRANLFTNINDLLRNQEQHRDDSNEEKAEEMQVERQQEKPACNIGICPDPIDAEDEEEPAVDFLTQSPPRSDLHANDLPPVPQADVPQEQQLTEDQYRQWLLVSILHKCATTLENRKAQLQERQENYKLAMNAFEKQIDPKVRLSQHLYATLNTIRDQKIRTLGDKQLLSMTAHLNYAAIAAGATLNEMYHTSLGDYLLLSFSPQHFIIMNKKYL